MRKSLMLLAFLVAGCSAGDKVDSAGNRVKRTNQLRQIGLAYHDFFGVKGKAPEKAEDLITGELDKEAAAIRQQTFEFIPYLYSDRVYAIRPGIKGVHLWTGYFTISFKDVRVS